MTDSTYLVGDAAATKIHPNHVPFIPVRVRIDVPKILAALGLTSFESTEKLTFFQVPAGTFILGLMVNVLTAEGASCTIDIGDGTDTDGFVDDLSLNSTGWSRGINSLTEGTPNTFTGFTTGKLYTTADTLEILWNTNSTNLAVFDVFIILAPLSSPPLT